MTATTLGVGTREQPFPRRVPDAAMTNGPIQEDRAVLVVPPTGFEPALTP